MVVFWRLILFYGLVPRVDSMYAREPSESHLRVSLRGSIERQSRHLGHHHHRPIPRVTFSPSNTCVLSFPWRSEFDGDRVRRLLPWEINPSRNTPKKSRARFISRSETAPVSGKVDIV